MTIRDCYEFALIECNKLKAPSILLEDFIYLFNKAIQQYVNSVYNRAEYNQQSSDDLSFLQTIAILNMDEVTIRQEFNDTVWELSLPKDYLHLLNCIAEFTGSDSKKGYCGNNFSKTITSPCHRLTANLYPGILNNYYMKPSHKRPYFYIINHNTEDGDITNPSMDTEIKNKESYTGDKIGNNPYRFYVIKGEEKNRVVNQSTVKIEIHSGDSDWKLNKLYVTYLKAPMYVSMSQDQILQPEDNTQNLEFPDYVCYEIINIYVRLFLENASDPRLQSNVPINQSIAIPGNNK